ncbi:MAG: hypothetical protein QOD99_1344 [Chthoniobacter sp.]|jgi:cell division protein FtsB|nr:hypothetical protein [Chthoniobacter sp.]
MTDYAEFRVRRQQGVWHSLNRLLIALIAFAVITLVLCAFIPEVKNQREQNARLEQLRAEIAKQKVLLTQRTREVDLLKNDPGYVETIARDRLDLMKEGETIYRLESASPPPRDKTNFRKNN